MMRGSTMRLWLVSIMIGGFLHIPTLAVAAQTQAAEVADSTADSTAVVMRGVTVIASLAPVYEAKAPFTMETVDSVDLALLPVRNVTDALAYVPGVDVRRRGALGVQTDVAIRGGTFEQTAVMLNGIRLNDVQTGHNTLSLPFLPSDMERIEVLKGGAARFLGAGALDGAVNFVLSRPRSTSLTASFVGGDVGLLEGRLSGSFAVGPTGHRLSAQALHHNGWMHNSDAEMYSAMYQGALQSGSWDASLVMGVTDKAFGANGFYTPRFPDQYEKVRTYYGGLSVSSVIDAVSDITIRTGSRINFDDFVLRRDDPDFYHNKHRTDAHLVQAGYRRGTERQRFSTLLEVGHDAINSTNLGIHDRLRGSLMAEYVHMFGALRLSGGIGLLVFSDRAPLPTGGLEGAYELGHPASGEGSTSGTLDVIYGNVQRSGRIPTYTELYYKDPQTTGNAALLPEHALTAELGYRRSASTHRLQAAVFARFGENIIDYAIDGATGMAMASNITSVNVIGLDVSGEVALNVLILRSIRAGVTVQDVQASSPSPTRYVADNLSLLGVLDVRMLLPLDINAVYLMRVIERVTDPTVHVTHDVKLSRTIGPLTLMAEATNLSNESFIETGWVPVPPRWFRAGVAMSFHELW